MAEQWWDCVVHYAGANVHGNVQVGMSEANGAWKLEFSAPPAMNREMLATALTAVSTGFKTSVLVDNVQGAVIQTLLVLSRESGRTD